jgi:hypothetical protein
MTTGRINQITIFKQNFSPAETIEKLSKVVRFCKVVCMILAATSSSNALESLKDLCFHDLQPTRGWLVKRR